MAQATQDIADQGRVGARLLRVGEAPLHTQGRFIVDRYGERVKWGCVNVMGAESKSMVPGGLEVRPVSEIAARIVDLGFNCVRLPYSVEAGLRNPVVLDTFVEGSPELRGKRFWDVFDATIDAFTSAGLMVIIDNHVSKAGWCCFPGQDEGLWYVDGFPAEMWIESLANISTRYRSNPLVVAHSIRNEVHDYGATKLTWGDGNPATDWALAATNAGNAVLKANPDMLVIVMGICAGICLSPARDHPIILEVPNRVVYEIHNYVEYVFTNLIPRDVVSWDKLKVGIFALAVLWILLLAATAIAWWRCGRPKFSCGDLVSAAGWWIFAFGLLCAVLPCVVWYIWTKEACDWWARNVVLAGWTRWPLTAIIGGLLVVLFGGYITRRYSHVEHRLLSLSDEEETRSLTEGGRDDSLLQKHLGRVGVACGMLLGFTCYLGSRVEVWSSYEGTRVFMHDWWGFLLEENQPYTAPVFVGEFGYANQGVAWTYFMRYLSENEIDFAYWALNGKKYGEGYINPKSGKFFVWACCDSDVWFMEGTSCRKELGEWAAQGRDPGMILDVKYWEMRPDTCVYSVPTHGTCAAYCQSRGRECVKARANDTTCGLKPLESSEELESDGCLEPAETQICVCTTQLWMWDNETYGILDRDYDTVKANWRIEDLQALAQYPSQYKPHVGCLQDVEGYMCDDNGIAHRVFKG